MAEESTVLPCEDKLGFASRREAEAAGVAIDHQRGVKLKAYSCSYCTLWHLASQ